MPNPLDRLRHHVSGAIARGEAQPIEARPAPQYCQYKPTKSARINLRIAVALSWELAQAQNIDHNVREKTRDLLDFLHSLGSIHIGTHDQFQARRAVAGINGRHFNG